MYGKRKKMVRGAAVCAALALGIAAGAAAYHADAGQRAEAASPKKKKIRMSVTKKTVKKGKSFTLTLKNTVSKKIKWSVKSKKILKLRKLGKNKVRVTGCRAGTSYVYAKLKGKTYVCRVRVKAVPTENKRQNETKQDRETERTRQTEVQKQTEGQGQPDTQKQTESQGQTEVPAPAQTDGQTQAEVPTHPQTEGQTQPDTREQTETADPLDGYTFRLDRSQYDTAGGGYRYYIRLYTDAPFEEITYRLEGREDLMDVQEFHLSSHGGKRCVYLYGIYRHAGEAALLFSYKGTEVAGTWLVCTSEHTDYFNYLSWKADLQARIWNEGMSDKEKLEAAGQYILDNYDYNSTSTEGVYGLPKGIGGECTTSTVFLMDCAGDLGLETGYCYYQTATHMAALVKLDGLWHIVEAGYTGEAGNRGRCVIGTGFSDFADTVILSYKLSR